MLNRSAKVVKPRQPFLDWLYTADPTSRNLSLRSWFKNRRPARRVREDSCARKGLITVESLMSRAETVEL